MARFSLKEKRSSTGDQMPVCVNEKRRQRRKCSRRYDVSNTRRRFLDALLKDPRIQAVFPYLQFQERGFAPVRFNQDDIQFWFTFQRNDRRNHAWKASAGTHVAPALDAAGRSIKNLGRIQNMA